MTWTLRLAASLWLFLSVALAQTPSQSNAAIERRVNEIVGKMTIEQKLDYIGGYKDFYIRAMPELGLPQMKMADGPVGVRNYGPSTSYAGGIALEQIAVFLL